MCRPCARCASISRDITAGAQTRERRPNVERLYLDIGRRIRDRRLERGLTQEELGRRAGLTRQSIANLEAGTQRLMLHFVRDLAEALDLTPAKLLDL